MKVASLKNTPVWIYGFYDDDGKASYVGQTVEPNRREAKHRGSIRSRIKQLIVGHQFKIIRETTIAHAARIEMQIIKSYQRRGQCRANIQVGSKSDYTGAMTNGWVIRTSTGKTFYGFSAAGRYYGVTAQTVANAINRFGGKVSLFDGETFRSVHFFKEAK